MYVGMTLALVGLGVLWAHPLAIALSAVFPAYIDRFQIPPEERAMERLFGHAFRSYAARVPRWL
jgi:protein-S-isoprenylcysteine O-methyltransferase Ste14